MDLFLKNKTALITGSSQGIGFAIANSLAKEGTNIILNGRDAIKLEKAAKVLSINFPNIKVQTIVSNFSTDTDLNEIFKDINSIDILINNIGLFEHREFKNTTELDWNSNFNVNVMSGVKLSQYFLPLFLKKKWGRIVFIGSEFSVNVENETIQYGVTKAAVAALSNGIAKLTKDTEITVNTILAGATYSDSVANYIRNYADINKISEAEMKKNFFKQSNPNSLLGRFIETEEIASIVTFISSPLSVAINGSSIRVDAGNLKVV